MIETIETIQQRSELIAKSGVLVIKYGAGWCKPCIASSPAFKKLADEEPGITYATEDIDLDLDLFDLPEYIRAIPAFHIYKDGVFTSSYLGVDMSDLQNALGGGV